MAVITVEMNVLNFFITQGPWAVLFIIFYFRNEKRSEKREQSHDSDMRDLRKEMTDERSVWAQTLRQFSEKYDIIIDELRGLKESLKK